MAAVLVVGMAGAASARTADEDDADWQEIAVPPAPSFSKSALIGIDMPTYTALKFGVDPTTLTVTRDGVVRYVMVALSPSGSSSAMYEGIRCKTGEFKTYARFSSAGQWVDVKDSKWRPLNDNNTSRHALAMARQGACDGRSAAADNPAKIIYSLKDLQKSSP